MIIDLSEVKPGFCFKPELRQAIREERKTQTRRLHDCKYKVGDVLYMREPLIYFGGDLALAAYRDDCEIAHDESLCPIPWRWQRNSLPQIHMPKIAARTFYRITEVRRERLQDISEVDAASEGVGQSRLADCDWTLKEMKEPFPRWYDQSYRVGFFEKWCKINGPDSWEQNPEVYVYGFEVLKGGQP